jgi:hypothetical protein
VHWRWWHLRIEKRGGHIVVYGDEQKVFDVKDEQPLEGGHLAFWSVYNGVMLARVRVAAARRGWEPQKFWCEPSDPSAAWEAVEPGTVRLAVDGDMTRVVNRIGGGTFAARWKGGPVDLGKTPVLQLPFHASSNARVNIHLQVGGQAYIVPVTGPTEFTPHVLCPAWSAMDGPNAFYLLATRRELPAACFVERALPQSGMVTVNLAQALAGRPGAAGPVESVIIGNTSNKDYLLAGSSGNQPGAEYFIGVPQWLQKAP